MILIRDIKDQVKDRMEKAKDAKITEAGDSLIERISAIEEELYQVRNRSGQDPLNFPIKLNNRLASLRRSVERGDARPTDAAHKVFEELSAELAGHLSKLDDILTNGLGRLNQLLRRKHLEPIEAGATGKGDPR